MYVHTYHIIRPVRSRAWGISKKKKEKKGKHDDLGRYGVIMFRYGIYINILCERELIILDM